jgi:hypothetical protein
MRRPDLCKLSGQTAALLAGAYPAAALLLPAFVGHSRVEFLFTPEVVVPYWGVVGALAMTFFVESYERLEKSYEKISRKEFDGLEIFHDADEFLDRLSEITLGAEVIATLNFSPPAGSSGALDRYFDKIHAYISAHDTPLKSFRSIASIEGPPKANWIAERAARFLHNKKVSFACFGEHPNLRLMCYHITLTRDHGYCAFYPPVPLTGVMSAFVINNRRLAEMMMDQFELTWAKSIPILAGGVSWSNGLRVLQEHGADPHTLKFGRLQKQAIQEQY